MAVKPLPDGYHSITPSICIENCAQAIDFYKRVFGAEERMRMLDQSGAVAHAELKMGDSVFMLSDPMPGMKKNTMSVVFYTKDCDAFIRRAVEGGCAEKLPVTNMFWGDRAGSVADPFGNNWFIATHVEDVPAAEMERRMRTATPAGARA